MRPTAMHEAGKLRFKIVSFVMFHFPMCRCSDHASRLICTCVDAHSKEDRCALGRSENVACLARSQVFGWLRTDMARKETPLCLAPRPGAVAFPPPQLLGDAE